MRGSKNNPWSSGTRPGALLAGLPFYDVLAIVTPVVIVVVTVVIMSIIAAIVVPI